jgi:hypothetical protein
MPESAWRRDARGHLPNGMSAYRYAQTRFTRVTITIPHKFPKHLNGVVLR